MVNHYLVKYMILKIEKIEYENFHYWNFSSEVITAKVYYWFFEDKFTLEEFQVKEKRKGYGTQGFKFILEFLKEEGVFSFFLSSRDTKEAQLFWKKLTGHNYDSQHWDYKISTEETIKKLSVIENVF